MRVAFLVPGFSADEQDWCIPVLVDVLSELSRHVEAHVFSLRYPPRRDDYRVHGIRVHSIGAGQATGLRRAALFAAALARISRQHRSSPFDVIHGLWADEPGAVAVVAAGLLRVPSAVSVMGGELVGFPDIGYGGRLSRVSRLLTGFSLRAAGAVTSASVAAPLRNGSGPDFQRLIWGVDSAAFLENEAGVGLEGSFRILQVGSLVPVKDQIMMIQAMAHLRSRMPGAHLHLVGEGPMRPSLESRARSLGVSEVITFHGHVPRQLLGAYYRAASVLAVSSRHEMQPVVTLEAALFGLPVVGTQVGLLPELAIATVPVGDAVGLASAIEGLSLDPLRCSARLRPSQSGVASNAPRPDLLAANTAHEMTQMYESMIAQHRRRRNRLPRMLSGSSPARRRGAALHASGEGDAHE